MMAILLLVVLALVVAVVWMNLAKNPGPRAKLGPDSTNVREPESFVVHHEGKAQGLDIANTALKERTEHLSKDLPGGAHKIKAPAAGRDLIKMDAPPSNQSKYGDEKVAPGAVPGMPHAESKDKVLTEGPRGSRPETPEEPGSPYSKGRRVTDNHRDMELAADLLPSAFPGMDRPIRQDMAASPSTNGQEPGYGLGRTAPGETDGEGGYGEVDGGGKAAKAAFQNHRGGKVVQFRSRTGDEGIDQEVAFQPDASWAGMFGDDQEIDGDLNWTALQEQIPLPAAYGEDAVVAMVRNPRSLYVYWEPGGHGDENLLAMLGDEGWNATTPCLRVFDVTTGAFPGQKGGDSFTIDVSPNDDHWFVNEGIEPGHTYVVSYDRRTAEGQHYLISHSDTVDVPAGGPSESGLHNELYGQQPNDWSGSPWR